MGLKKSLSFLISAYAVSSAYAAPCRTVVMQDPVSFEETFCCR